MLLRRTTDPSSVRAAMPHSHPLPRVVSRASTGGSGVQARRRRLRRQPGGKRRGHPRRDDRLGNGCALVAGRRLPDVVLPVAGITDRETLRTQLTRSLRDDRDLYAPETLTHTVADNSVPAAPLRAAVARRARGRRIQPLRVAGACGDRPPRSPAAPTMLRSRSVSRLAACTSKSARSAPSASASTMVPRHRQRWRLRRGPAINCTFWRSPFESARTFFETSSWNRSTRTSR
jgi:hypothetical protein